MLSRKTPLPGVASLWRRTMVGGSRGVSGARLQCARPWDTSGGATTSFVLAYGGPPVAVGCGESGRAPSRVVAQC